MKEVESLMKELDEWVTKKADAIKIVVMMMDKFDITPQDFVDTLAKKRRG